MSFTAYVAVKTESGYDIYRSHNGGDDYLLRSVLKRGADKDIPELASELPSVFTADVGRLAEEFGTPGKLGCGDLIEDDPTEVGVNKREITSQVPAFETEVLYIVEDGQVETYIPVNPSPTVLDLLRRMTRIKLYRVESEAEISAVLNNDEKTPDVTLDNDNLTPSGLESLPKWAQLTVEQCHRYFASNTMGIRNNSDETKNKVTVLTDVVAKTELRNHEVGYTVSNLSIPIRVRWENDEPNYPMYRTEDAHGALPKVFTSRLRYETYPEYFRVVTTTLESWDLPADQAFSEYEKQSGAVFDHCLERLVEIFGESITSEYLPENIAEHIDKHKKVI